MDKITHTTLFECCCPGCKYQQEFDSRISYVPQCPGCGTNMHKVAPPMAVMEVSDIRAALDDLMGYTAEDIKNEI